jgi:tRNA pseudouridine55 synthase
VSDAVPLSGWIVLDKPLGLGSTNAVSAVKRALREAGAAKTRVGHGGTLDPLATGVLPIALGEATKLAGRMLDAVKAYDFTITFGVQTDTLDAEGKVVATSDHRPLANELATVLTKFTGAIEQMPPAYSALKVDGRRAYDLARAGEEVVLKARGVTVFSLFILPPSSGGGGGEADGGVLAFHRDEEPLRHAARATSPRTRGEERLSTFTLSATVSKGTYIRSLARDIALALGTVGHVTMLRRTQAGPFGLDRAISLDFLDECARARELTRAILPFEAGLDDIPALAITPDQARQLRHGQRVAGVPVSAGLHVAMDGPVPVALVEILAGDLRVVRGLNL